MAAVTGRRARLNLAALVMVFAMAGCTTTDGCAGINGSITYRTSDFEIRGPSTLGDRQPGQFEVVDVAPAFSDCPYSVSFRYFTEYPADAREPGASTPVSASEDSLGYVENIGTRRLPNGSCATSLTSRPLAVPFLDLRAPDGSPVKQELRVEVRVTYDQGDDLDVYTNVKRVEIVRDTGGTPAPPVGPAPVQTKTVKDFIRSFPLAAPTFERVEPRPTGVALLAGGLLLHTDRANRSLVTTDRAGAPAGPFATPFRPVISGFTPELDAPVAAAQLRDGRFAVADLTGGGGGVGQVRIYDPSTSTPSSSRLAGIFTNPSALDATPDGSFLAVGDADSLEVFTPNAGGTYVLHRVLAEAGGTTAVTFDRESGRLLAVGADGRLRIFEPASGTLLGTGDINGALATAGALPLGEATGIAVDPTTQRLWVTDAATARVIGFSSTGSLAVEQIITQAAGADDPLRGPRGIAIDDTGSLFVADDLAARVAVFADVTVPVSSATRRRALSHSRAQTDAVQAPTRLRGSKRFRVRFISGRARPLRVPSASPIPGSPDIRLRGLRAKGRLTMEFRRSRKALAKLPAPIRRRLRGRVAAQLGGTLIDARDERVLLADGRMLLQRAGRNGRRHRACFEVTAKATPRANGITTKSGELTALSYGRQTLTLVGGTGVFRGLKLKIRTPPFSYGKMNARSGDAQLVQLGRRGPSGIGRCKGLLRHMR